MVITSFSEPKISAMSLTKHSMPNEHYLSQKVCHDEKRYSLIRTCCTITMIKKL